MGKIEDDRVWRFMNIYEKEISCWRTMTEGQNRWFVIRDREPLIIATRSPELISEKITIEFPRMMFKDRDEANRYIIWRALKLALEADHG